MRYRKLRIAWSAAWGVVALLLCVLWVRSYWVRDRIIHNYAGKNVAYFGYEIDSLRGLCSVAFIELEHGSGPDSVQHVSWPADNTVSIPFPVGSRARSWLGFRWESSRNYYYFIVPYWFPAFALALLAAMPYLPWRFSLRTLLIATTLVAVTLGFLAWAFSQ